MPKRNPPVELQPAVYEDWLLENPKAVDGGPIVLEDDPDIVDDNAVILPSRHVNSAILPKYYAEITIIFSQYSEFDGIQFYVVPNGFDYLIRADQTHHNGKLITAEGYEYGDYPHFHELDYYRRERNGQKPGTRRRVSESLHENITPSDLLEAFMSYYYICDGRAEPIQQPKKKIKQKGLDEFGN
jgi:hypothetical protein